MKDVTTSKEGAFGLHTREDWLAHLERELQRFRASPNDRDAAISFFVKAESMLDWKFPGDANARDRNDVRDGEPLLHVVWDLASLAKHLEVRPGHVSVDASGMLGEFFDGQFFDGPFFGELSIKLKGAAATQFGERIRAVDFAERVLQYWRTHA